MAEGGISDDELVKRLSAIYGEDYVAGVAKELADARTADYTSESGMDEAVAAIHKRFTYRMQDLAEFMKGLLQRFTQWFNRAHSRSGTLWEDRFKSVIVEDGVAARTLSAYIDLNPVRAGMVEDPAEYRWSSYGEAVGGGKKGNGKKAREGLVRAYFCDQGVGFEAEKWEEVSRVYRRLMGLALGKKPGRAEVSQSAKGLGQTTKNTAELLESKDNETILKDLGMAKMLRCRVRYFTDGAVIGSKEFVNEAFAGARERFGPKRKDGARKLRGGGAAASGSLWSLRDLRKGIAHPLPDGGWPHAHPVPV
jgi:putative transposase